MKKDLLTINDLSSSEINDIFKLASELKRNRQGFGEPLKGKTLGLIFEKPSNRTRVSFEVGITELGGHAIYLGSYEIDLGKRESPKDVAKVLSRYLNGIIARTFSHKTVVELAKHSSIPVINGLTDYQHPCQALSDLFTIKEKKGLSNITVAFIGDGNNVLNSLLCICHKMGLKINAACPKGYEPSKDILKEASSAAIFNSPSDAVKGADVIYTDVWTSMGQEKEYKRRLKAFKKYQVNAELMKLANKDAIVLHCLPAHRGQEITDEVMDGPASMVLDQAENRMHVQKAILIKLLK
ncbi:MAG: ornithine carbamoyltransferase [Candidatus Omnitrophota bacterium]|nr:MAG: ornithine carbamoyltransferase [Omnitrophica bacterium GWA2_41_15]HAZ11131.1 ornithine carbamoyltransferase [Candidatus Omnitrophota bacterium]